MEYLTQENFDEIINSATKPILVDFYADWCAPCRMLSPQLEILQENMSDDLTIVKVNTQDQPDLQRRFGVQSIPTLILFEDGVETSRLTGARPANVMADYYRERLAQGKSIGE